MSESQDRLVSYAQNYEDVMLWRALAAVENGFYIDVGACSPEFDSVTRLFYDKGWQGINVEPNPRFHHQLVEQRSRDINLCVALSDAPGQTHINFFNNAGLSTLDDTLAQQHEASGFVRDRQAVEVSTLNCVWSEHVPPGQEVHFLKVDVEGLERSVLAGNDWARHRAWVVVVESTLPMSQVQSYDDWEPLLLAAGYLYAYADGLNRFYVHEEQRVLMEALRYPPNVFDEFVVRKQAVATRRVTQLEGELSALEKRQHAALERSLMAEKGLRLAESRAAGLASKVENLQSSLSWRLTAPLRLGLDGGVRLAGAMKRLGITALTWLLLPLRWVLSAALNWSIRNPGFKNAAVDKLGITPEFEFRVFELAKSLGLVGGTTDSIDARIIGEARGGGVFSDREITAVDYFDMRIPQTLCENYGLNIDFPLVERIRRDGSLPYLGGNTAELERQVVHVYLALLYRHPSGPDCNHWAKKVRSIESFELLFKKITSAPEFELRGYRRVL